MRCTSWKRSANDCIHLDPIIVAYRFPEPGTIMLVPYMQFWLSESKLRATSRSVEWVNLIPTRHRLSNSDLSSWWNGSTHPACWCLRPGCVFMFTLCSPPPVFRVRVSAVFWRLVYFVRSYLCRPFQSRRAFWIFALTEELKSIGNTRTAFMTILFSPSFDTFSLIHRTIFACWKIFRTLWAAFFFYYRWRR